MQIHSCSRLILAMTKEIRQRELSNCRIKNGVLLESLTMIYLALFAEFLHK